MRVIMKFDVTDEQRELITKYVRKTEGTFGLPKLAGRKLVERFITEAYEVHQDYAKDEVYGTDQAELKQAS